MNEPKECIYCDQIILDDEDICKSCGNVVFDSEPDEDFIYKTEVSRADESLAQEMGLDI